MAILVIKSNASTVADVLVADLGYLIPLGGLTPVQLDNTDEIAKAQTSKRLRAFLVDDAYGAGSSTLILNSGSGDLVQADAINFLDTLLLPAGDQDYGVVKTDDAGEIATNLVFDGSATISNALLGNDLATGGNEITGLPATPSGPTSAPSTAYVDGLFVQSRAWKELLLHPDQLLDGVSGAIRQAVPFYLRNQPTSGDTLSIDDGTVTRTYGFGTGGDVTVTIGASVDDTLDNLAAAITSDASLWNAVIATDLESINDGTGAVTAGRVVVIYRTAQTTDSYDDRIYGTFTTAADARYVNYNGVADYQDSTNAQVPAADTAQKEFGIGRAFAALAVNETHLIRSGDGIYTWDDDGQAWQLTGTGAIDYGLVGDIQPLGSSLAAGVSTRVARADHVHTHGDRGGDGAGSQHDADQVDVEATLSAIGAPGSVEAVFGNIDALFKGAAKCGKVLHAAYDDEVKSSGEQFLVREGGVLMSIIPYRFKRAGILKAGQVVVDVVDATRAYKLSVRKHATLAGALLSANEVETVALPVSTQAAQSTSFTTAIVAGDYVALVVVLVSGTGKSTFANMFADIEWNET